MQTDTKRTWIAVLSGLCVALLVVAIGVFVLAGPVREHGMKIIVVGGYKLVLAATVVGAVLAGLVTTVKVYRRMGRSDVADDD